MTSEPASRRAPRPPSARAPAPGPGGGPDPLRDLVLEGELSIVGGHDRGPRLVIDYFTAVQTDVVEAIRAAVGHPVLGFGEERFGPVRIVVQRLIDGSRES